MSHREHRQLECQCEHIAHTEPGKLTPSGRRGHRYGERFSTAVLRDVFTPWGPFRVCPDCALDCYRQYIAMEEPPTRRSAYPPRRNPNDRHLREDIQSWRTVERIAKHGRQKDVRALRNPRELSRDRKQFLHDIFVTALEGGIGYWSQASKYRWSVCDGHTEDLDNFVAVIHDTEDNRKKYTVDRAVIQRGLSKIASGTAKVHESYVKRIGQASRENDFGNCDAGDADVIVQAGLFGEVVYG